MKEKGTVTYGFEEYDVFWCSYAGLFTNGCYSPWPARQSQIIYPLNEPLNLLADTPQFMHTVEDHTELLQTARKVYVHPDCTIPRNLITTKYRKALMPYSADVVVVPKAESKYHPRENFLLFTMEPPMDRKKIIAVPIYTWEEKTHEALTRKDPPLSIGCKLKDVVHPSNCGCLRNWADAELVYKGQCLRIDKSDSYVIDLLTHILPNDRTVSQKSMLRALGSESNTPDFDTLSSIDDMLGSEDLSVVDAALKTLAALDYVSYPESVKMVLMSCNYKDTKALHSSSVKFMLKTLTGSNNMKRNHFYSRFISQKDFDIFMKLLAKKYQNTRHSSLINYCYSLPFLIVDAQENILPRIKP